MSSPERVKKICGHIVSHFRERIEPNRYKAMIVAYDRECCLMYKRELNQLMPPEASVRNIEEVKRQIPCLVKKCLDYFPGADRTIHGWLSWVYESLRPDNGGGALVWAELGAKTIELIHRNINVGEIHSDDEIMTLDGNFDGESKSEYRNFEADLTARIKTYKDDFMYQHLGLKVERLKQQLELGLITSAEYLRQLGEFMREAEKIDKLRENLTELFRGMNVPPEQIISDIYDSVSPAMTGNWKNTTEGTRNVKLLSLIILTGFAWLACSEGMSDYLSKIIPAGTPNTIAGEHFTGKSFL